MLKLLVISATVFSVCGCMNLATPPSQISSAYVSSLRYEGFGCQRLAVESEALTRRENQLVIAQEQRRETSKVQAFWTGYGHGDGIEASELANVRGEQEAVRKAMAVNSCSKASA